MSSQDTNICIVCGIKKVYLGWKVVCTKGKGIQFLCSPKCVDMYMLNPLAYATQPFEPFNEWVGVNSIKGWTFPALRKLDKLIIA